jgi:hypothetical protein
MVKQLNFAFLLVILDHDTGRFTLEGPMTDDGPWVNEIVFARRAGRRISCFPIPASRDPDEAAARHVEGCIKWPSGSIVLPERPAGLHAS